MYVCVCVCACVRVRVPVCIDMQLYICKCIGLCALQTEVFALGKNFYRRL